MHQDVSFVVVEHVAHVQLQVVEKALLVRPEDAQSNADVAEEGTAAQTGTPVDVGQVQLAGGEV